MRLLFTSRPHNLFSYIVRKVTKREFSHVAIQLEDGFIYEAVLSGCRRQTLGKFLRDNHVQGVTYVEGETSEMQRRAVAKLGSSYDVPALFWFLFYLFATNKGWSVPRLSINPKWMLCSEYVHYILTGETETVTPADLYDGGVW